MATSASLSRWSSGFDARQSRYWDIAQLVEHPAVNRRVAGSSPVISAYADVAQLAVRLLCKQWVVGSTPSIGSVAIGQRLVRQIVALHIRVQFPIVTPRVGSLVAKARDCKSPT